MKNNKKSIHELIPGGCHTYSKGDDQFSENAPSFISHGNGAYVFDLHNNKYLDCTLGLLSISLGHGYKQICKDVSDEIKRGTNFQRPSFLEYETAKHFTELIHGHSMVKFTKNGSTATTAAVKLARAFTGRNKVAFPQNHPFYSYDDWFIASTNCNKGVSKQSNEEYLRFHSCSLDSLKMLFEKHPQEIACVISEPIKNSCYNCECISRPEEFLKEAIEMCHFYGALFVLDEMQTGFRYGYPGFMNVHGLTPDLATWGKGIANGFSFSALSGKEEIMKLGGIKNEGQEKVFLVSTTHGAESSALRAFLSTSKVFKKNDVINYNQNLGSYLIKKLSTLTLDINEFNFVKILPCPWLVGFEFNSITIDRLFIHKDYMKTYFMQYMIENKVLIQSQFAICFSHQKEDIDIFVDIFKNFLKDVNASLSQNKKPELIGSVVKPVFRKII